MIVGLMGHAEMLMPLLDHVLVDMGCKSRYSRKMKNISIFFVAAILDDVK
jgi:hypothetical protein